MQRSLPILVFFLGLVNGLIAQETLFKGRVTDSISGEPIPGAAIKIKNGPGKVSDINGNFEFSVPNGTREYSVSFVGYKTFSGSINFSGETLEMTFRMKESATELGVVVVSAGKFEQKLEEVTVSMEVLKPDLIENKNTNNLEHIMDQIPGVSMLEGQVNIRGGSGFSYGAGSRVILLVDDLPMLSADAGDVKWNFLPVENIAQVEVIKGASSALFGSSALNGVVNLRTAYPTEVPKTTVNISSGMYDDPRRKELQWWGTNNPTFSTANFFHSRQVGRLDLVLGSQLFSDEGYRELEKEQRFRFNTNLRYRFKKVPGLNAGVNFNVMRTTGGLMILWAGADSAYKPQGGDIQLYNNTRFSADPFVTYFHEKKGKHSFRSRIFETDNRNSTDQSSLGRLIYGEYQFQTPEKNGRIFTTGISGNCSEVISDSLYGYHTSSNLAVYFQADKKYKRWNFSFGIRGEYFKVDTAQTRFDINPGKDTLMLPVYPVARAGVNYEAAQATFLRASFGQGYRFPSIAEKFIKTTVGGLVIYPNPELQPETGWSAEIGVRQGYHIKKWKGYADLALFWTEYRNMMEFNLGYHFPPGTTQPTLVDYFTYFGAKSVNVGQTRIQGAELSLGGSGSLGKKSTLNILGGYTYIKPVNLNFDSTYRTSFSDSSINILKYRYEHMAKLDIQYDWKKLSVGISLRYNSFIRNIDRAFVEPLFSDILPTWNSGLYILPGLKEYREKNNKGELIVDHRISWELTKNARINFVTNNLFNVEYMGRPGDMQPPRNYSLQVILKF